MTEAEVAVAAQEKVNHWARVRLIVTTILIGALTILVGWVFYLGITGQGVSNEDLLHEMRAQSCILSLPLDARTPEAQEICRQQAFEREETP